jgi:hypothetical protein
MTATLHVFIVNEESPLVTTLLPAVIGAFLGFGGSFFLRRGEHAWQEQRDRFARDLQVAQPLDHALIEIQRRIQNELVPDGESRWMAAYDEWQDGWVRITPHLTDGELEDRYRVVGTILLELNDRDGEHGIRAATLVQVAMRAILNARIAVAYFLRGASLPPACFPGSHETIELLGQGEPNPLAHNGPLRQWLGEHEPPPWR